MSQNRDILTAAAFHATRLAAGFSLAALLVATAGCQHRQLADKLTARRLQSLSDTADTFAKSEGRRPRELCESLVYADSYFRRQAVELGRNINETGRLAKQEAGRVEHHLIPYSNDALRIMYGKPEEIEENAIILFY